ncbi:haloacid dehalogenase type II [Sulfolobus acidocaldarius]|uniref:Haloacid dehalogenase-like hydrolase n=4 Tax=Sulfolobus acidocaldarius TaxID=2285 RepID=Q4JBW1_SULAC|nr:haloacid dehalogenase type II [Sulfolobus acidocaldarius]AAY79718.1 haloacid dehalogenase-like hydrolase [Sulfolobus acidocaldarius DSM 639]AGE70277.1 haloacid dehalogenase-like hydrolase [Sulfolobus acidocaldarius N8]AGE72552.1 haloacid dehalogenase-like hydrolase [Sulfolobus acidocaldarius Ron12/I]ALU29322.1 haloacetate dehalogenase [Sulfolobus acidocaldarius]ALU32051.1 haloacetate dehalogenase [Sulfolobus acidocaldarius]
MKRLNFVLAFDVFGTILDLSSIIQEFRRKQLEYTWLLTILGKFATFEEITKLALQSTLTSRGEMEKFNEELNKWNNLRSHSDAKYLQDMSEIVDIYALSNGSMKEVSMHLEHNGLLKFFKGVVSAEEVKVYKPSPLVYKHFMKSVTPNAYLVSSNPFDVIGAKNAGMGAIYVNRFNQPIDPLGYQPDLVVKDFHELHDWLKRKLVS